MPGTRDIGAGPAMMECEVLWTHTVQGHLTYTGAQGLREGKAGGTCNRHFLQKLRVLLEPQEMCGSI